MSDLCLKNKPGISIICSTKRESFINNILDNFLSQDYENKELILLLNYNNPSHNEILNSINGYDDIQVFHQESNITLGQCLNYGISKAKYPVIAKFDDDDHYYPNYLNEMIYYLYNTKAHIVGKSCIYIFFSNENILAVQNISRENQYVNRVYGSTLVFKKEIFNHIKFKNINLGEDMEFCKDAIKNNYKIFSTTKKNYIYIRRDKDFHTWKMDNKYILNQCSIVNKDYYLGGR